MDRVSEAAEPKKPASSFKLEHKEYEGLDVRTGIVAAVIALPSAVLWFLTILFSSGYGPPQSALVAFAGFLFLLEVLLVFPAAIAARVTGINPLLALACAHLSVPLVLALRFLASWS